MRNTFIDRLVQISENKKNIVLIVGDLGYSVVEPFAERFPDRFFNAGVAEQNMIGMAAGLASEGFHVFCYSIANFPTFRCAEQLRNDVDHHVLPVTVVAVGGGLAYGNLGYSHHAVQDYGLIRLLPNTTIAAPGDPQEVESCLHYLIENPGPSYLRLGKTGEPNFHSSPPKIELGQWVKIREGKNSNRTFLCTGTTIEKALQLIEKNPKLNDCAVHSVPLWGAKAKRNQADQLRNWREIITIEDHYLDAGFGSWILECCAKGKINIKIEIEAIETPKAQPLRYPNFLQSP